MLQHAANRWRNPNVRSRAGTVQISGIKAGFRANWKVPDPLFYAVPGVQEIIFITQSSNSKTDRRYKKPYQTIFRFPLNPKTGQPYASVASANELPVWVHCSCPAFRYYCEVHSFEADNSDIIDSNRGSYTKNEPTYVCKHIFATAKEAMRRRKSINKAVTSSTLQKDPAQPKTRDAEKADSRLTSRTPLTANAEKLTPSSLPSLPSTWIGRLAYILFNEK